ncbi:tyrosine-type recombinase/integrase [Ruegeria profundi]|uniref:tyrosine-type recombinase/integrase n=1 Tax=Ruegeria profundi TaxID=1685378 RepID=UPI001CD580D6|nr:integrase family protein [Ruegeria profundi]MCA0927139.1 integrase family protein [Ruegeria profundi]
MQITDTLAKAERGARDKTEYRWDNNLKGFGLRLNKKGSAAYVLKYKVRGNSVFLTLGKVGVVSAKQARQVARETLGRLALGEDLDANPEMTVDGLLEWYRDSLEWTRSAQYQKQVRMMINNQFPPRLKRRLVAEVSRAEWLDISERQARKGHISSANWIEKQIKAMLNRAVERGYLDASPLSGIRNRYKTASRDRVLSDSELKAIWRVVQSYEDRRRVALEAIIITACRRSEILGLLRQEYEDGVITLSAERVKNRKPHMIALPSYLRSQFDLYVPEHDTLFFGNHRGKPHGAHLLNTLRTDTGIADFTLHDLRRTAATRMASLGVLPHVIEACLNHQMAAVGSVASVYNRYSYATEKADAWALWEQFVLNLP